MSTPITVIGNVTANPQLSTTHGGTPVTNLTLAENHRRRDDAGDWVDGGVTYWQIVVFGTQAEHIIGSLTRGVRAIAVGSPRTRTWTAADGEERSQLEIVADEIGPSLRWATTEVTRTSGS